MTLSARESVCDARLFADANFAAQTAQDDREERFPLSNTNRVRAEPALHFTLNSSLLTLKKAPAYSPKILSISSFCAMMAS